MELAKKSGKNLIVCVTNISKGRAEYLSVDTTPDLPITLALRMTSAIPMVFEPVKYKDDYYLDGALTDGFPYAILESKLRETLCITTSFKTPAFTITDDTGLCDLVYHVFNIFCNTHPKIPRLSENYTVVTIDFEATINTKDMNITLSKAQFESHVDHGYITIKNHDFSK